MAKSPGVIGDIIALTGDRDAGVVNAFFETKDFKKLMQLTEIDPDAMYPLIVMNIIRLKYKSKLLKDAMESFAILHVSKDRKGRDEFAEVALASRRGQGSGMEDD